MTMFTSRCGFDWKKSSEKCGMPCTYHSDCSNPKEMCFNNLSTNICKGEAYPGPSSNVNQYEHVDDELTEKNTTKEYKILKTKKLKLYEQTSNGDNYPC